MRVVVTGASGFIGRHLSSGLKVQGADVFEHSSRDGDMASCELGYSDVDHVFHLAGLTFVPDSWQRPAEFCRVNVLGTSNVLELCRRNSASLTYLSSYVYGVPQSLPISEQHRRAAVNPYALSKILAEDMCLFYAANFGTRTTVIRPFNIYGRGQGAQFLIPTIIDQAIRPGNDPIVVDDGRPKRDFLHVSDLVQLLLLTLDGAVAGVYNAGSGVATSIEELVGIVTSTAGRRPMVTRGQPRKNEILEVRADISKAERELKWKPTVTLETGIRELVLAAGDASG